MNYRSFALNKQKWEIFKQKPHPCCVDDLYHVLDLPNALNIIYWWQIFKMVEKCKFDSVVECGVGRGRSLISILTCDLFRSLQKKAPNFKIFALDSFRGFPPPSNADKSFRKPKKGDWSKSPSGKYKYSTKFLLKVLILSGFKKLDHLRLVPGYFSNTIPRIIKSRPKIGILHLDGDLYKSILDPLIYLSPHVVPNGVIVLDDLFLKNPVSKMEPFPGARKALFEFMKKPSGRQFKLETTLRGNPILIKNNEK